MKQLFTFVLAAMLVGVSCSDPQEEVDSTPKGVVFASGTEMSAEFGSSGGSKAFVFTTDLDWEVTTSADWISVTPSSGTPSVKKFTVKASANDSFEERNGTVTMTTTDDRSYTIEVKQAAEKETFTINSNGEYVVKAAGGEVKVKVTTNLEYTVEIPAEAKAWLSVADTRAVREETLTFTVAENASFDERSATVELKGADGEVLQSIVFKQKGEEKVFDTDGEGNYVVEAVGGEVKVKVTTNLEYTVEIPAEAKEWLSVADTRAVIREETLTFAVAENASFDERSATVELKGADGKVLQSIVFKQKGEEKVFDTDGEGNYIVEAAGGEVEVKVTTNLEYTVEIPAEAKEWLSVADTRAVIREETLTFTVAKNETLDERSANVELKDADGKVLQSIVFKQKGEEKVFDTDGEGNYVVEAAGGEVEVKVTTNLEYTVEIPAEAKAWLSVADTRAVIREETLTFTVAKNETLDERSVKVIFSDAKGDISKSVKITQLGCPLYCVVPNDNEVLYITTDGEVLDISDINLGSTTVIDHTYEDGIGRITCSSDITLIDGLSGCTTLEQIAIPDSVTTIGGLAFRDCTSLTGITIPDSVTTIGDNAFYDCDSLTSVTIPDSVMAIGDMAFRFCDSLTSVTIGDSVTTIGYGAFEGCSSLTSVTIGDSVTAIGDWVFKYCNSLTCITIPDSVTTIGEAAFVGCISLTEFKGKFAADGGRCLIKDNTLIAYANTSGTTYTIPDSVTTIGDYAFYGCNSLISITIPDSVTSIRDYAFDGCHSLTSITISDRVTWIGDLAFHDCYSLTSVPIPDSVTSIGARAFDGCTSLTNVTIPDSVTEIEYAAFYGCSGELIINSKIVNINYDNFDYAYGNYPARFGWLAGSNFSSLTIGNNVTRIGAGAFFGCTSLKSVTIPDSVTKIGDNAFAGGSGELIINSKIIESYYDWCSYPSEYGWLNGFKLTSLTIGNGVTKIGDWAFYGCSSLTSVTIPDSVTTIGGSAFRDCTSLKSINIPESVTSIGSSAFYGCTGELIINSNIIETDYGSDNNPTNSSSGWLYRSKFTKLTIGDNITKIGDSAFRDCSSLTSITIPDSVTTIGDSAFYNCNSLTSITIPDSVTTIGDYAFYSCYSLTGITIPDSVTSIGARLFSYCLSLKSINIPKSVTSIGDEAFRGCDSLKSVTIPDGVTEIGAEAFYDCSSLKSVIIGKGVTSIGKNAFSDCDSLKTVWCRPYTPPEMPSYSFGYNESLRIGVHVLGYVEMYKIRWSEYSDIIFSYDYITY